MTLQIRRHLALWMGALLCAAALSTPAQAQTRELRKVPIGGDVELAVRSGGQGPVPVIFVHGYSLSMDTWDKVIPMFPTARYTTIAYDLRGFGDSSKPASGFTMAQHVRDLAALMDRLQIRRAVLVGHSLGGAISQEFATLYPERVLAFVTSDAFARFNPMPGVSEAVRKRADGFGSVEQNREMLKGAVPRYFDPRNANPADVEKFLAITLKSSTPALRDQLIDAYAGPQLDIEKYRRLSMPVLAATGAMDNVVPAVNAIAISDVVPDSELLMVPRTGHTPMWERPEAWAGPVVNFLDRRVRP
jgi:pimeloyl-ACP methyl ester carboxylesterase